ncbi:hypothetical protein [Chakrabartyella piscis]|uniref:hypothetical protein n=1 Tax=Chakrabartyella piscis TaxID=2918914 RepID=UPI0029589B7E|nr:hypothetical protein [Chakrabartyella piscis]
MKKIITALCLCCILSLGSLVTVFATGDSNIDSGGGSLDNGTATNVWSPGMDGVRVSVVRASDYKVVTTSVDITNKSPASTLYHFGKVSKLEYNSGDALSPVQGGYSYIQPTESMPTIISEYGSNNITAIKSYFTDEQVLRSISEYVGMDYDILIGGDYKLLLEPIGYYTFEGVFMAATATETALYDELLGGLVKSRLIDFSHKNLPLSMFLETSDLGYPAWTGSTIDRVTDSEIISSLGLGIVRFTELPEDVEVEVYDYEYRVDTEVITSVYVKGGQSDPDDDTTVYFTIDGTRYSVSNVYYPSGDGQIVWVKWTTPSEPQEMVIDVSVSGPGDVDSATITCNIIDLDENPPPNPVADDRNDDFSYESVPNREEVLETSWTIWDPWWQEYWVDNGYWKTKRWTDSEGNSHSSKSWVSKWEDEGWWGAIC